MWFGNSLISASLCVIGNWCFLVLVPNITPSNVEDVDNLFKSLQLEKVVNIYQLGTKDTGLCFLLKCEMP